VRIALDAVDYALLHEDRFLGVHPRGALGAEHDRVWVRVRLGGVVATTTKKIRKKVSVGGGDPRLV
jgi:hypothetical protein